MPNGSNDLERRFDELADRFVQRIAAGLERVGTSGGGAPSSGGAGGSGGGIPGVKDILGGAFGEAGASAGVASALGGIGAAALQGAGKGIRETPAGALGSPEVLANNAAIGAAGAVIDKTIGQAPIVGDLISAQFHAFEDAVRQPAQRAEKSLGSFYGKLAAAGSEFSDQDIQRDASRSLEIERARFKAQRQVERRVEELNAGSSVGFGLSLIGL